MSDTKDSEHPRNSTSPLKEAKGVLYRILELVAERVAERIQRESPVDNDGR
jgi:hypothetical protein